MLRFLSTLLFPAFISSYIFNIFGRFLYFLGIYSFLKVLYKLHSRTKWYPSSNKLQNKQFLSLSGVGFGFDHLPDLILSLCEDTLIHLNYDMFNIFR